MTKKIKATPRERAMDEAIAKTRRPYNYRITAEKLDAAARESHQALSSLKKRRPVAVN